jgi:hypothetical protein
LALIDKNIGATSAVEIRQHGLKIYVKNSTILLRFLGVILHEKHDSDVIFTPYASEIVKRMFF